MTPPIVSVIIPVYNGAATLPTVLAKLEQQTFSQFEVIITDDCSTDETAKLLKAYTTRSLDLKIIWHTQNAGASAARNSAVAQATGDILVFIDADCVPDSHLLDQHLATHKAAKLPIGVVGRIIWSDEFKGSELSEYYKKLYFPDQSQIAADNVPFTYFVTSNASLPRTLFKELGGFDPDFRYLWDDTILGYRLQQAGYQLILNEQALVYHHRALLPSEAITRFRRQGQEAMRLIAKYPELIGLAASPAEILTDRYHQTELYQALARYALGLGYQEGAVAYFEAGELETLLAQPAFAQHYETWQNQRLSLYRQEIADLKADKFKTHQYVRHLEAAYQREVAKLKTNYLSLAKLAIHKLIQHRRNRSKP